MSDPFLDMLNALVFSQSPALYPFAGRPCGRLDAEFRQAADFSPEDVERALEIEAWTRRIGP